MRIQTRSPQPARVAVIALAVAALAGCMAATPAGSPPGGGRPAATGQSGVGTAPSGPPEPPTGPLPDGQMSPLDGQLIDAAGRGDTAAVQRLLTGGARIAARDQQGRTALIAAAYGNQLDAARALIDAGADVNTKDDTQQSAYLIATSEVGDDVRLLELTLAAGADVRALDSYRGTGLIRAADRGYPQVIARLLRAGVPVDHVNRLGWTALLEAVILGDGSARYTQTVHLLLDGGANPYLPDRDGTTALAHAQARDQHAVSRLLHAASATR